MSHRIYAPEFNDEAVRQVVERGHTVKEVTGRFEVSCGARRMWASTTGQ
jgi:transposase-like protein